MMRWDPMILPWMAAGMGQMVVEVAVGIVGSRRGVEGLTK